MTCSERCKNFICFLAVLAQVLTLTGSSQARSLLHMNVPGFQARNSSYEVTLTNLAAMLPKGAPLSLSGPSSIIS
ncbi:hypothetical protein NC651_030782 [Populus alba x Populus x berolinensis]|nr:hypothetical protein NC651_030782 [Populus alba x Populus x berolinensis]